MKYDSKSAFMLIALSCLLFGCGSDSTNSNNSSSGNAIPSVAGLIVKVLPAGLKNGTTASQALHANDSKSHSSYTADSDLDNVMGVFWNRSMGAAGGGTCTATEFSAGTCIRSAKTGTQFRKPTPLTGACVISSSPPIDPSLGTDSSSLEKACSMDTLTSTAGDSTCSTKANAGGTFNLAYFIPWYSSWGIPMTDTFHDVSNNFGGVTGTDAAQNNTGSGISDYKFYKFPITTDSGFGVFEIAPPNYYNFGYRNKASNYFYYVKLGTPGSSFGTTLSAFMGQAPAADGTLTGNSFEAYYDATMGGPNVYFRVKSNGKYIYYVEWNSAPTSSNASTPDVHKCYKLGATLDQLTDATGGVSDCVTSFGVSAEKDLMNDANWNLKVVPEASFTGMSSNVLDFTNTATQAAIGNKYKGCY